MNVNRLICNWWVQETEMLSQISAGKASEIKGVIYISAMALLSTLTAEMAPCFSHFIHVCKGNSKYV